MSEFSPPESSSSFIELIREVARQAVSQAADGSPHAPRPGQATLSAAKLLPACRVLLSMDEPHGSAIDALADLIQGTSPRLTDGIGHSRPVYLLLAIRLASLAAKRLSRIDEQANRLIIDWVSSSLDSKQVHGSESGIDHWLWQHVVRQELTENSTMAQEEIVSRVGDVSVGEAKSLHAQDKEESLDHWTFRELVGLHAFSLLAQGDESEQLANRCDSVAKFHQIHTQPDYTTYQPWALAVFARDPETKGFAEQQLHDVQTHLSLHGSSGAVVPALLLTDAVAMLENFENA